MPANDWFKYLKILNKDKHRNFLLLSVAALLGLMLLVYLNYWYRMSNHPISFSPSDVTYGIPFHADHRMEQSGLTANFVSTQEEATGSPMMEISERFYDFGMIDPGEVATRTFVIANRGNAPLMILNAYTTCGCTIADFTAQEIPPGKVALMTLKFDPAFHDLHRVTVRRGVIIQTNEKNNPSTEVWIEASVR